MLYHYNAFVISVYDGDTIRADVDLGFGIWCMNEPFRLARIDAPEVRGPERPQGLVARDWLRGLILNQVIMIETIKDTKGKYGRYIAELWLIEKDIKININDWLVKDGMAVYREY